MTISNATELTNWLNAASGGDSEVLADGSYGDFTVTQSFASEVTLTAQNENGPTFDSLTFNGASYVTFDGVEVEMPSGSSGDLVDHINSDNIAIKNGTITAVRTHDPNHLVRYDTDCSDCSIDGTELTRSLNMIGMDGGSGFTFSNLTLHHYVQSGFRTGLSGATQNVTIEDCYVYDNQEYPGEPNPPADPHGSVFAIRDTQGLTIRRNHVRNSRKGWLQIYADTGGLPYYDYQDFLIEFNLFYDVNDTSSFMHNPGSTKTHSGFFIYRNNTFIAGYWDESWTASDDFEDRFIGVGPGGANQTAKFPWATEAERNICVCMYDGDDGSHITGNVIYDASWLTGKNAALDGDGNVVLSTTAPYASDKTYIDDDLFVDVGSSFADAYHNLVHGVDMDFSPAGIALTIGEGMGGEVDWAGAVNPATGLLGPGCLRATRSWWCEWAASCNQRRTRRSDRRRRSGSRSCPGQPAATCWCGGTDAVTQTPAEFRVFRCRPVGRKQANPRRWSTTCAVSPIRRPTERSQGRSRATASESSHSWWHGLLEWNESGVSDWTLDVATADGSNTSNVSSIQPGATGTLSSSTGVAMVAGTSRTGSEGLSLSVLTDLDSEDTAFVIDAGSANYIAGYQDLSATTSIDETVSESNGSSRMGAVMAVFVEDTGGGGGGGATAGTLGLLGIGI